MIAAWVVIAALAQIDGTLTLRGAGAAPGATVVRVDADGVLIRWPDRSPATQVLSLDQVRSVPADELDAWEAVAPTADSLWRAVSRIERGDLASAEPILERLFQIYRDRPGATGRVVAEGLLRCRLARHAHAGAIDPWIAFLSCGGSGQTADDRDAALIGPSTTLNSRNLRLFAALPPIWSQGAATRSVAESIESSPLPETVHPAVRHLRSLYATAAAFESDGIEREITIQSGGDPVLTFIREIVASRVGAESTRVPARESLRRRLTQEAPGWLHAWCRVAIARSLLREPEIEEQRRAIIELVAVHAYHASDSPYLAGLALADAARASEAIGDAKAARAFWAELLDRYPGHPATDASVARSLRPDVARTLETSAPDPEPSDKAVESLPEGDG